jgi:PPK2 family polyphosphate:nucleotide phosphotransferase
MELSGPKTKKYMDDFIVKPGKAVKLKNFKTGWAINDELKKLDDNEAKAKAVEILSRDRERLAKAQELLYADKNYAMLIVLQGMDTAGKDGAIRHVMSGVNPQGCSVSGFKVPSSTEHAHDFLWRYSHHLPERGMIGIFNRSHYEDVLAVKVHPDRMEKLPEKLSNHENGTFWEWRYADIRNFEKHLARNGTIILKFFLYISKKEQKKRLLDRLNNKDKYWKISPFDVAERVFWTDYEKAYEEMLSATSTEYAPWFIIPADYKWAARTFIAEVIVNAIEGLDLKYPKVTKEQIKKLMAAKSTLENEK